MKSPMSDAEVTLRKRLVVMFETLVNLIKTIKQVKAEVREYKGKFNEWRKKEKILSEQERTEQNEGAKR